MLNSCPFASTGAHRVAVRFRPWFLVGIAIAAGCDTEAANSPLHDHLVLSGYSGAALVVYRGTVLLRAGFGFADADLAVPNAPDLIYGIGSLTKPLTASAVLHAAERGLLDINDAVCDYVPRCPVEWNSVEVRHLLDHTSGIPDLFGSLPEAPLLETTSEVDRLLSELGPTPLRSLAGSEYSYSNFNYVLLGYILRSATREDWEGYLLQNVLRPAGAVDTAYDDVWAIVPRRARGYGERDGRIRPVEHDDHSAYAAGGLRSTVDDLRRWHAALVSGQVIGPDLLQASFSPNAGGYGYGWQIISALGRELQNHTGGIGGYSSHLAWYPEEELLIILLSNVEGSPVKALACDLARFVLIGPPTPTEATSWLDSGTSERCSQSAL